MPSNPTAFVQWLREKEPDEEGMGLSGNEVDDMSGFSEKDVHKLLEKHRKSYVLKTHKAIFETP